MTKKLKLLSLADLRERGVTFSRPYLRKLIAEGRFPRPIRQSERVLKWIEAEVDQWEKNIMAAPRVAPAYAIQLGLATAERRKAKKEARR